MTLSAPVKFLITIVGTLMLGSLSGLATVDAISGWYATLNKPSFNPPNWVFGPAWTLLYTLMGIAAGLVWSSATGATRKRRALMVYVLQLVLNMAWSLIFFWLEEPTLALVEILLLWVAIVWCIRVFKPVHAVAAYLLVPYLLWVTFASVLNAAIVVLN